MRGSPRSSALLVSFLLGLGLLAAAAPAICAQEDLDREVGSIVRRLEGLSGKGANVDDLVGSLDRAVRLADEGRANESAEILAGVRGSLSVLEASAEGAYLGSVALRYLYAALILSAPLAAYAALPRIYALLWVWLRRRWVVVDG